MVSSFSTSCLVDDVSWVSAEISRTNSIARVTLRGRNSSVRVASVAANHPASNYFGTVSYHQSETIEWANGQEPAHDAATMLAVAAAIATEAAIPRRW